MNKFKNGETGFFLKKHRENPIILHYYYEIIRYWNKINFIVNKTKRSIDDLNEDHSIEVAKYFYATYRFIWEKASEDSIIKELEIVKNDIDFTKFLKRIKTFSWEKAIKGKPAIERLSLEQSYPTFIINKLLTVMSLENIEKNLNYMNLAEQEFIIRVNTLKISIKDVLTIFENNNIKVIEDKDIPGLFHMPIKYKSTLLKNDLYQNGDISFQDKASVAVIKVLSPQISENICDLCAAPGMKTSVIAQFANNKSKILANDFDKLRIRDLKKITNRLNVLNCFILNSDGIQLPLRFQKFFDRVLLDAPCTGSGAFLSSPELKMRQNREFLFQNITLQEKLLHSALKILKPGGILVYATCSLYPEEGEQQILKVMDNLEPLKLPEWFSPSYIIQNSEVLGAGRLFPAIHNTQGFFIGKFKKKKNKE